MPALPFVARALVLLPALVVAVAIGVRAEDGPPYFCWQDVGRVDRSASMEGLRPLAARAASGGDTSLALYVEERLAELVGGDAARALEVVAWAQAAAGAESATLMNAVRDSGAAAQPAVAAELLRIAETADDVRRGAALSALETQQRFEERTLDRLAALVRDGPWRTSWVATRTIGRVMETDYRRTGRYRPYTDRLLEIARRSPRADVRLLAVEMVTYPDPLLDAETVEALASILTSDTAADVRRMAAMALSTAADRRQVLDVYAEAFPAEKDLCARWATFRFAARAAGEQALPLMERMAREDARFQEDLRDFQRLYAAGHVDFARVWRAKRERHACHVEAGAPHPE